jgi:hypothetical protein
MQFITYRTVKSVQHFSSLIGYVKDEQTIVRISVETGQAIAVDIGEKLTIRVSAVRNLCPMRIYAADSRQKKCRSSERHFIKPQRLWKLVSGPSPADIY